MFVFIFLTHTSQCVLPSIPLLYLSHARTHSQVREYSSTCMVCTHETHADETKYKKFQNSERENWKCNTFRVGSTKQIVCDEDSVTNRLLYLSKAQKVYTAGFREFLFSLFFLLLFYKKHRYIEDTQLKLRNAKRNRKLKRKPQIFMMLP